MRMSDWSSDVCSSDLPRAPDMDQAAPRAGAAQCGCLETKGSAMRIASQLPVPAAAARVMPGPSGSDVEDGAAALVRSEEHTSELQSLMRISYAVFCLKKKINLTRNKAHSRYNH